MRLLITVLLFCCFYFCGCNSTDKIIEQSVISRQENVDYNREAIVDYASRFLGSRYKYAGNTPKGFDCSGFVNFVFREFNYQVTGSSASMVSLGKKKKISNVQAGDLLFFARGSKVFHVAIVVRNDKDGIFVIHSTSSKGVRMDNVSTAYFWKDKLFTAREVIR